MSETVLTIGNEAFDLVHAGLFLALIAAIGTAAWLVSALARTRRDHVFREAHFAEMRAALTERVADLESDLEDARAARHALDRELAAVQARSEEDERKFSAMAQSALRQAHQHFLQTAEATFQRHQEAAKGDLGRMIDPIGKGFAEFKARVEAIEKVRAEDKSLIQEQVRAVAEGLATHSQTTARLVNALSAPKGGGRWGETTLRNVMEHAGLSKFCDFTEQAHDRVEGQSLRPDVVIRLPGGREIVVDAKVSLDDYLKAVDATDPAARAIHLKAHGRNIRSHVSKLASKPYQAAFSDRVDFVALFIPGENFYVAALEHEPDLFDYAASKQVIVVTPSTLLALAKAVAYGWRQEQASENARQAAELGRELYVRLSTLGDHLGRLGQNLNKAVDSYNKFGASLERRVLSQARRFEDLQIAPPDKAIAELEDIELRAQLPHDPRAGEVDEEAA